MDWPETYIDADETLAADDPWLQWATRLLDTDTTDYNQIVAKALRGAYWRGQGEQERY
jgi:hypothetical protein